MVPGQNDRVVILETHSPGDALTLADAVWPCYDAVFGDADDAASWRAELFERHAGRDGYRLVTATGEDGTVVGFSWGYLGQAGQFWTDLVTRTLPPGVVVTWVGGHFEVVELAVLPAFRRQGLGRRLHDTLIDGVRRRCLLSTSDDEDDPAVRLYRAAGWQTLGRLRDGVQVMGLNLFGP